MPDDAVIIPFPVRDVGTDDLVDLDALVTMTAAVEPCVGCGSTEQDEHHHGCEALVEDDPDEIAEAGGRWVWEPVDGAPEHETPVGMVAYSINTMCRWTHRHLMDGEPIPQPCCYSVLTSIARLPGPVREHRNWLAMQEDPS
jgi:hypothetical protein